MNYKYEYISFYFYAVTPLWGPLQPFFLASLSSIFFFTIVVFIKLSYPSTVQFILHKLLPYSVQNPFTPQDWLVSLLDSTFQCHNYLLGSSKLTRSLQPHYTFSYSNWCKETKPPVNWSKVQTQWNNDNSNAYVFAN